MRKKKFLAYIDFILRHKRLFLKRESNMKKDKLLQKLYSFESPEVIYFADKSIEFSDKWVTVLKENAILSPRKTCRLCLHKDKESSLHQMIILHNETVKVPIHRHLKSDEIVTVLSGSATIILFKKDGDVSRTVKMDQKDCMSFRIPKNVYHTIKVDTEWFLFQETILGPFRPENTEYAT